MEKPLSATTFKLDDILRFRKLSDVFYSILAKLTNSQLREFCQQDLEFKYCAQDGFWEKLWKAHQDWDLPPKDLNIRQAYFEKNLLDSLVEEIVNTPKLRNTSLFGSDRDQVRATLTKSQTVTGPNKTVLYKELVFINPIGTLALKTQSEDLLAYYFLNETDFWREIEIDEDKETNLFIDSVLQEMRPLTRLPLLDYTNLAILIGFANETCSEVRLELLKSFFEKQRDDQGSQLEDALSMLYTPKLCTPIEDLLIEAAQKYPPAIQKDLADLVKRNNRKIFYALVQTEDVEDYIKTESLTIVRDLLSQWNVDRINLLRELLKENRVQFWIVIEALADLNLAGEEQDEEYQEAMYELFKEVRSSYLRKGQKETRGPAITPEAEVMLIKTLRGPYLVSALKYAFTRDAIDPFDLRGHFRAMSTEYNNDLYSSKVVQMSASEEIADLLEYVQRKKPGLAETLKIFLG